MPLLPIALLLIPVLEIYVLVQVGQEIGFFATLLLLIFSAVLGLQLMRSQGATTMRRAQESLQRGQMPTQILLEGGMLWLAGVLFLIPGLISDVFAILLLLPGLRRRVMGWFVRHPPRQQRESPSEPYRRDRVDRPAGPDQRQGDIIEGEYRREDEK